MTPTTPLKLCAIAFTVLWSGWMLWSSGSYEPANIIILAVCGSIAGYLWYRIMRWCFRRMHQLPDNGAGPGATP
jgi:glycopeptide antibiotics resistance protein